MLPSFLQHLSGSMASLASVLLREALYSIIVATLVWCLLRLWPQAPARWRMALWSLVLLRLVLPTSLAHPFSARTAIERFAVLAPVIPSAPPARSPMSTTIAEHTDGLPVPADSPASFPLAVLLGAAWLAGASLFAATYMHRYRFYRRTAAEGEPVRTPRALELSAQWRRRFGVRRTVTLVATSASGPPFTVGVWRPVIVLPARLLADGQPDVLETVIAHEMAHIRRFDELSLFFVNLLQAFYFFNPAVWLACRHLHLARECVCDAMVLAHRTVSPARYGKDLLAVLSGSLEPTTRFVSALGHTARQWQTRLRSLRHPHSVSRLHRIATTGATAAAAWLLLPMAASPVAPTPPPIVAGSTVLQPSTPRPVALPSSPAPSLATVTFANPVPGSTVSSGFGERLHPVTARREFHSGVDLAATMGTPVMAAAAGVVTKVSEKKGQGARSGVAVRITHSDELQSFYAFLERPLVTEGQSVAAGQTIGSVGSPVDSTGPHLHFQIHERGHPVNPIPFID